MADLLKLMETAKYAAREAGKEIMHVRNSGNLDVSYKAENKLTSIVTRADKAADKRLKEILLNAFPEAGWLSEETSDDKKRLSKEYVWVVDPLDGTRYFAKGENGFVVSIALVHNCLPQLGVIYQPVNQDTYYASKGNDAFLNGKRIHVTKTHNLDEALFGYSPSILSPKYDSLIKDRLKANEELINAGTALRMTNVAEGKYDFSITIIGYEWDFAAGDIIVREAGGIVSTFNAGPLKFNQENTSMGKCVYSNKNLSHKILDRIGY